MAKKVVKIEKQNLPTSSDISRYEMLEELLSSIYEEMKEFSKKKPDEALNKFKVTAVNRVLIQIKDIMKNEPTNEFLDLLDDASLPSNCDSILIIGQCQAAMSRFRSKYCRPNYGEDVWSPQDLYE